MKKILIALAGIGLTYCSAQAQETKVCEVKSNVVCRKGGDCYKTKYAENFKVCKNDNGYFICCESPNYSNSTHTGSVVSNDQSQGQVNYMQNYMQNDNGYAQTEATDPMPQNENNVAPQSQSYPGYNIVFSNSYEGYYPQKGKIKSCYVGNNVAQDGRAPYNGCSSPQDDGADKNIARNLNVVTQ